MMHLYLDPALELCPRAELLSSQVVDAIALVEGRLYPASSRCSL